jgi:hypothetical protein
MSSPQVAQFRELRSPPSTIYSNIYSLMVKPEGPQSRPSVRQGEAVSKMQGKRIKTAEEETEYSSKHSQIMFRNSN